MENITNWISEHGVDWGIQIAIAIAIFIVGKIIARMISNLVEKGLTRAGTDKILVGFLGNMSYGILLIAVVLAGAWGVLATAVQGALALCAGALAASASASASAGDGQLVVQTPKAKKRQPLSPRWRARCELDDFQ